MDVPIVAKVHVLGIVWLVVKVAKELVLVIVVVGAKILVLGAVMAAVLVLHMHKSFCSD